MNKIIKNKLQNTIRDVSHCKVLGHLTSIKLILQSHLDSEPGEGNAANRGVFGVHTSNPRYQEVSLAKVEFK